MTVLRSIALFAAFAPWTHAQELHTKAQDPRYAEANAALEAHDFDKAARILAPLAAANPKDANVLYDLGSAQDALDQAAPAEQSYRAAIADDPKYLAAHVALGLLLARNGRHDDARVELLAATALPGSVSDGTNEYRAAAYRALARLDEKSRPGDARDELLEALRLSPETRDDTLLGAHLAESAAGGAGAAEQAYRRVLAEHPDDPAATAQLANLLVKEMKVDEAEDLLNKSLKEHPGDAPMTLELANLYNRERKTAQAVPLIEALHATNPADANISRLLGGLYVDTGDYARAEPLLAALSAQNPHDTGLIDDRARSLIHLQRYAEAQAILSPIVAQPTLFPTPGDLGNAAGDLAFAASSNNAPEICLQALAVRATVLPTSAPSLFLTAISHDKLRHTKLAIEAYKQFIEASNGSNPDQEFEARHRIIALEHVK